MEIWTSWIQRRLEKLQGRGDFATNNLITVLKIAILTNDDLLSLRFDNRKMRGLVRRCCCCCCRFMI